MRVLVAGNGIVGRTTAIELREAGFEVEIVHDPDRPPSSVASCALVLPYFGTGLREAVSGWASVSWQRFADLAGTERTGVSRIRMVEMFREKRTPDPILRAVAEVEHGWRDDLPEPYQYAWDFNTWLVETPIYYEYLAQQIGTLGIPSSVGRVDLAASNVPTPGVGAVVDCAGHWSRGADGVQDLIPVRGQCIVVRGTGLEVALGGDEYVVAQRSDGILIGSLWQEGVDTDKISEQDTGELLARLAAWQTAPIMRGLRLDGDREVTAAMAGARPFRLAGPLVEALGGDPLRIRNVGHGGAGVALSWGAASEVVRVLADAVAARSNRRELADEQRDQGGPR